MTSCNSKRKPNCACAYRKFEYQCTCHVDALAVSTTSYEPWHSSAYSTELRWTMIWQRLGLGYTYKQIGANLGEDSSTVRRTVSLFELTGQLEKHQNPKNRIEKKLTHTVELILLMLVIPKPGILFHEIQTELSELMFVSLLFVNFCFKSGFRRQKMILVA